MFINIVKTTTIIILLFGRIATINCQDIAWQSNNVAGAEITIHGIDYSYSIGQVFSAYLYKGNELTDVQGYQQTAISFAQIKKINNSTNKTGVKAYPNPVNEKLWIVVENADNVNIKVFNNLGHVLGFTAYEKSSTNRKIFEFEMGGKKKGLYIFHVYNNGQLAAITKVVKI